MGADAVVARGIDAELDAEPSSWPVPPGEKTVPAGSQAPVTPTPPDAPGDVPAVVVGRLRVPGPLLTTRGAALTGIPGTRPGPRWRWRSMPKLSDAEWSPWLSCRRCSGTAARPSGLWHAKCHLYQTFPYLPSQSDCNHVEAGTVTPPGGIDDWHILEDVPPTDPRPLILLGTPVGGGASRHRPGGRRRRGPDGSVAGAAFTPHPASTAPVRASKADLRDRSAAVTECRLPRGRMSGWVLRRGWG